MKNNFRLAIAVAILVFLSGCGNAPKDNTPEAVAMFCVEHLVSHTLNGDLVEKYFVPGSTNGWQEEFYKYDIQRKKELLADLDKKGVSDRALHYVHTQTLRCREEGLWGIGIKECIGSQGTKNFTGTFYVIVRMVDGQWRVVNPLAGNLNIVYKDNKPVWEEVWKLD